MASRQDDYVFSPKPTEFALYGQTLSYRFTSDDTEMLSYADTLGTYRFEFEPQPQPVTEELMHHQSRLYRHL